MALKYCIGRSHYRSSVHSTVHSTENSAKQFIYKIFSPFLLINSRKMLPATVGFNVSSSFFILSASSSSSLNHAFPNRNCMSIKSPITKSLNCSSFQPFQVKFRRNLGISASSSAVSEFTSTDDSILSTPPQKQVFTSNLWTGKKKGFFFLFNKRLNFLF